jgi:hypothetical protein
MKFASFVVQRHSRLAREATLTGAQRAKVLDRPRAVLSKQLEHDPADCVWLISAVLKQALTWFGINCYIKETPLHSGTFFVVELARERERG